MPKVDWRELSGGSDNKAGALTPPIAERSRSEGDLNRNSYRSSEYPRLAVRAICNDDGTPITETTDELLRAILKELQTIREMMP